jgi:hypothetical protein
MNELVNVLDTDDRFVVDSIDYSKKLTRMENFISHKLFKYCMHCLSFISIKMYMNLHLLD